MFIYRALVEEVVLEAPSGSPGFLFGEALALEGDVLAVSASTVPNPVEPTSRVVYVFRFAAGRWGLEAELVRSDDDGFGMMLGVAGGRVFVAAPRSRAVEVYGHGAAGWSREHEVRSPLAPSFGRTFCARAEWIAVSAGTSLDGPAVEVFTRDGVAWRAAPSVRPGDAAIGDHFGAVLACTDSTLTVGDPSEAFVDGVPERSAVHIFDPQTGARTRIVTSPAPADGERFGEALAVDDDALLASAPRLGPDVGAVLLFEGDQLRALGPVDPVDDASFGRALAISRDHLWIAAPDAVAADTGRALGAVYVVDRD
ncbi:hypothetical protein L6R52_19320 [Myxococcota bacterium]|nr:hypothetical protein [Myxococcota bacterium]